MTTSIHEHMARLGLALSNPARLRALNLMAQRPWRVSELAQELGEGISATSAHLKVLRAAHLVEVKKSGRDVWCRVAGADVIQLLSAIHRAADSLLPEVREMKMAENDDAFLLRDFDLKKISADAKNGQTILVDLRPADEFAAGHLPGSQSWPYHSLSKSKLKALKNNLPVITYCRGPWCQKARLGVETFNKFGISAKRLPVGVVDWQAAGFSLSHR